MENELKKLPTHEEFAKRFEVAKAKLLVELNGKTLEEYENDNDIAERKRVLKELHS
jgi:hypothetical protein